MLIGNNIDGFVNVDMIEFNNFDAVKTLLPNIIKNLKYEGEWTLNLYQINGKLKIKRLYGYYKMPSSGKLILGLSYMNINKHREITINDGIIHVYSYSELDFDEYNEAGQIENGTIYENYVTVLLFNKGIKKSDVMEEISVF
jgi:hypothetical protein